MRILGPQLPSGHSLPEDQTLIMGILNVTPDSFSDGGRFSQVESALAHARSMIAEGAHIVDVGGESTRPGSTRIDTDEEWRRIGTVVAELVAEGVTVSVDTLHASTARKAADAGVAIINDVSGGNWDPAMLDVVADSECAYIVQHFRALPGPQENFDYGDDLVGTLVQRVNTQVEKALSRRIDEARIVIDPGLGFSLTNAQSMEILDHLSRLKKLGYPVLIGASRKRFVTAMGGDRDERTAEITAKCAREGIWALRVHEIAKNARAARKGNEGLG